MSPLFLSTVETLNSLGYLVYVVALVLAFLESLAFVGLLIPSTTLLLAYGFLGFYHVTNGPVVVLVVALGGVLGDVVSYEIGTRGMRWFKPGNKIFKIDYVRSGEDFFARHGAKSVFLARFLSPLRPIIPFVAGLFSMSRARFFAYALVGSFFSTILFVGLGYGIGAASEYSIDFFPHVPRYWWFIGFLLGIAIWWRRSLLKQGERVMRAWSTVILAIVSRILVWPRVAAFMRHHQQMAWWLHERNHRRLLAPIVLSIALWMVACAMGIVVTACANPNIVRRLDTALSLEVSAHRSPFGLLVASIATAVFSVTGAGIIMVAGVLVLYKQKAWHSIIAYLGVIGGTTCMVALLKHGFERARPGARIAAYLETGFSFPSFHAAISAVISLTIAYILTRHRSWKIRSTAFCIASMVLVGTGFSRVYVGVHFGSDVLAGWMVGGAWFLLFRVIEAVGEYVVVRLDKRV